ncbi:serine protease [Oscillospiraceae bacterium]|nr:serine protease [Oscillospiraceae bacterium]BDF76424.1 serine protease [Oscillospiraceae bacterium]
MKKLCASVSGALCALLLLTLVLTPARAADFDRKTLNGVIFIIEDIVADGEALGAWSGTGFFVGASGKDPQYIVTNYHVIEYYVLSGGGQGFSSLRVAFDQDDFEEAYVVAYNEEKDLAVLKLDSPTDKREPLRLKSTTEEMVGTTVFAVGYPGVADETFNYRVTTLFGKDDATVTGGRVNRLLTEGGTGRKLLQMDVSIRGGNSGGPLVDESGAVVGINTLGSTLADNLNYAVSVDELLPLLINNNIPYEMAGEGGGLLPWILIAAAAAVVVAAVVILAVTRGRKRKAAPEPAAPAQPQPQQSVRRPVLRSMSAQHNGMKVPVGAQAVLIGRDVAACRIVFREGTAGVSARHCSVAWDGGTDTFVLTDLKSTYGTFLADGRKLAPGVPYTLKPRDSFYLGGQDNVLYVDLE